MIHPDFRRDGARHRSNVRVAAALVTVSALAVLGTSFVEPPPPSYVLGMAGLGVLVTLAAIYLPGRLGSYSVIGILVIGSSAADDRFLGDPRPGTLRWWQAVAFIFLVLSISLLAEYRLRTAGDDRTPN